MHTYSPVQTKYISTKHPKKKAAICAHELYKLHSKNVEKTFYSKVSACNGTQKTTKQK